VFLRDDPNGHYSAGDIESMTERDFIDEYTLVNSRGKQPTKWILGCMDMSRMPSTSNYTAENTSDEWSIKCTTPGEDNHYFDGWLLVNETQKSSARVASYISDIFTLEEGIYSQADTDKFHLVRKKMEIKIYPAPQYDLKLCVLYTRDMPDLYRDYDVLQLPEEYCNLPSYYAAGMEMLREDHRKDEAREKIQIFNDGIRRMKKEVHYKKDKGTELKPKRNFCTI